MLTRPKNCPASLFNMMKQCWKREPLDRPTFNQMYTYLLERRPVSTKPKAKPTVKPPVPKPRTVNPTL